MIVAAAWHFRLQKPGAVAEVLRHCGADVGHAGIPVPHAWPSPATATGAASIIGFVTGASCCGVVFGASTPVFGEELLPQAARAKQAKAKLRMRHHRKPRAAREPHAVVVC
jgi:hypothetical protein